MEKNAWLGPAAVLAAAVLITGCHSTGTAPNPPIVKGGTYLYVDAWTNATDTFPGVLLAYKFPLLGNDTPAVSLTPPTAVGPFGIAQDSKGRLAVSYSAGGGPGAYIAIYKTPLTASSKPEFTFASGDSFQTLAFDANGDLFAGNAATLYEFTAPLSSSSTPSVVLNVPPGPPTPDIQEVAISGTTLAVASGYHVIFAYTLPITAASTPYATFGAPAAFFYGVAFDSSGNLYVTNGAAKPGSIEIFNPPFTSASTPSLTFTSNDPNLIGPDALDSSGNLYITDSQPPDAIVFAPPFTTSSVYVLLTSSGQGSLNTQLVVGP